MLLTKPSIDEKAVISFFHISYLPPLGIIATGSRNYDITELGPDFKF